MLLAFWPWGIRIRGQINAYTTVRGHHMLEEVTPLGVTIQALWMKSLYSRAQPTSGRHTTHAAALGLPFAQGFVESHDVEAILVSMDG